MKPRKKYGFSEFAIKTNPLKHSLEKKEIKEGSKVFYVNKAGNTRYGIVKYIEDKVWGYWGDSFSKLSETPTWVDKNLVRLWKEF